MREGEKDMRRIGEQAKGRKGECTFPGRQKAGRQ